MIMKTRICLNDYNLIAKSNELQRKPCVKKVDEITDQLCLIDIGIVEEQEVKCLINY